MLRKESSPLKLLEFTFQGAKPWQTVDSALVVQLQLSQNNDEGSKTPVKGGKYLILKYFFILSPGPALPSLQEITFASPNI